VDVGMPSGERAGLRYVSLHPAREAASGENPLINLRILSRPAISWGLRSLLTSTGTYYALLFTLAHYLQHGLGRSALSSGLVLLPWVTVLVSSACSHGAYPPGSTRSCPAQASC
jgi:hypothetical protein